MTWSILEGDAHQVLQTLDACSVQTCVTSPPYWGLRDYGHPEQLGLEATPDEYVAKLVQVFSEVSRVLRHDGTLWINLGDSYCTRPNGPVGKSGLGGSEVAHTSYRMAHGRRSGGAALAAGLKHKDLVGIPWRVAFALQADGWYLRSDIIWSKPNPMPESVKDRPTKSHEYVFMLSKGKRYYWDQEAVREEAVKGASGSQFDTGKTGGRDGGDRTQEGYRDNTGRNIRSVWNIATQPFPGAHFAVMPPALVEPCIKAGAPIDGVVLDPFAGAGTVGVVARRLQRRFIGIELNPTFAEMARRRIDSDAPLLNRTAP